MAEKITKIQIGADVREIGLGLEAGMELGTRVMELIANTSDTLEFNKGLNVKLGGGLTIQSDKGVAIDSIYMRDNPDDFHDQLKLVNFITPKMGTFAGAGLKMVGSRFAVRVGTGLKIHDSGDIVPTPGDGIRLDSSGISARLGSGLQFNSEYAIELRLGKSFEFLDNGALSMNLGTGLKYDGACLEINVEPQKGLRIEGTNGLSLDTLVAGSMLTREGNGTVVCLGSGLEVNLGTCMCLGAAHGVAVDVYKLAGNSEFIALMKGALGLS